jgi:hypothetical protein
MATNYICTDCKRITPQHPRCDTCTARREHLRNTSRAHYKGDYRKRAALVRANASICWICGDGPRVDDPWTADHMRPGDSSSPLAAAHRSCNSRRGNTPIDYGGVV